MCCDTHLLLYTNTRLSSDCYTCAVTHTHSHPHTRAVTHTHTQTYTCAVAHIYSHSHTNTPYTHAYTVWAHMHAGTQVYTHEHGPAHIHPMLKCASELLPLAKPYLVNHSMVTAPVISGHFSNAVPAHPEFFFMSVVLPECPSPANSGLNLSEGTRADFLRFVIGGMLWQGKGIFPCFSRGIMNRWFFREFYSDSHPP